MASSKTSKESAIRSTPETLVADGEIHTGFFAQPFRRVNLLDAHLMGRRWLRQMRLKEWVGFGITHPELFGGILIQNAKYLSSGVIFLYDRRVKQLYEWKIVTALGGAQLPETLWDGTTSCSRGQSMMQFRHELDQHRHSLSAAFPARRHCPAVTVALQAEQDLDTVDPLVVSLPIAPDHHTYTHKSPLRLRGSVILGDRKIVFDPDRDFGNLDEQKTFYPYRSQWKWGTFVHKTEPGPLLMLNFVNQMTPANRPGEDALWVDGRLELLPQPKITEVKGEGWSIRTKKGAIDLFFQADGAKREKLNLGVVSMDYAQMFGTYNGTIRDRSGVVHKIDNAYGPLEHMRAKF